MSTANVVKCGCCRELEMDEETAFVDPDLNVPVCSWCKVALRWAEATLRRRTLQQVSIYGMHGPRESPIAWDPKLWEAEYQRWLDSQKGKDI